MWIQHTYKPIVTNYNKYVALIAPSIIASVLWERLMLESSGGSVLVSGFQQCRFLFQTSERTSTICRKIIIIKKSISVIVQNENVQLAIHVKSNLIKSTCIQLILRNIKHPFELKSICYSGFFTYRYQIPCDTKKDWDVLYTNLSIVVIK
jgi:hypothetical protein